MGPYKRAAGGVEDVTLTVREPTLGGLLAALRDAYPEAGRKLVPSPGTLEPAVRVVLNDVVLSSVSLSQVLRDRDRVAFVPIVGGGSF